MSSSIGAGPRRPGGSIVANPVLIGAVTILVVTVAVFLSYNANSGLPFVPTYEISVNLADASELVPGNDVREGGSRIGAISAITAQRVGDKVRAVARIKVAQRIGPLPVDTHAVIRQRSSLGLKYLQLIPGASAQTIPNAGTMANAGTPPPVDIDDLFNVFDPPTRRGLSTTITNLGVGLAGRGGNLNRALQDLPQVFGSLPPVARNLADPQTKLSPFIRALNGTVVGLAPVTPQIGSFLSHAATTFDALNDPPAITRLLDTAAATFAPITRDLAAIPAPNADANRLLARLTPGLRELPRASRTFAAALRPTVPALADARPTFAAANPAIDEVGTTVRFPATSTALRQLSGLTEATVPTLTAINPFQTRCNYLGLWTRNVPSFISEGDTLGTWFRAVVVAQPDEILSRSTPAPLAHADYYPDAGQNGTCEAGNTGYIAGRQVLGASGQRAPSSTEQTSRPAGVSGR